MVEAPRYCAGPFFVILSTESFSQNGDLRLRSRLICNGNARPN